MSYTVGEDIDSTMRGRRTRFRGLFSLQELGESVSPVLDYRGIKTAGEKLRYKDLYRSRTLTELWASKINRPEFQRSKTAIPQGGENKDRNQQPPEGGNLKTGIITQFPLAADSATKVSAFKQLPPASESVDIPPMKPESKLRQMSAMSTSLPNLADEKHFGPVERHGKIHHKQTDKEKCMNDKKQSLSRRIEDFYHDLEPLIPETHRNRNSWYLPPLIVAHAQLKAKGH